jgi:hypothetical protein
MAAVRGFQTLLFRPELPLAADLIGGITLCCGRQGAISRPISKTFSCVSAGRKL